MELFLECQSRVSITFKYIFSGEDRLWFFWQKGNNIFVTFIHICRKYRISMYFLRKISFHFPSKEKKYYWVKKAPSFQIIQERSYSSAIFFGKTIFSELLEKENMVFPCSVLKNKGGWVNLFDLQLKMTSWACLLRSGLKPILHWKLTFTII